MFLDFMARGLIAGIGVALVAGPLGCIVVWRRMANFGDALAHATLLGLCFSLSFNIHLYIGLITVCMVVACLLALLSQQRQLANDTILCILAYTTLAIGLILATVLKGVRIDLLGYLYGDILAVNQQDLWWIYGVDLVVFLTLLKIWNRALSMTVHEDLATVEGVPVVRIKWSLIVLLAIVFAVAMKLVGILLITALLVIPASAARQITKSPEQMAFMASVLGIISVGIGLMISSEWDWPAGPAIVSIASLSFLICVGIAWAKNQTPKLSI